MLAFGLLTLLARSHVSAQFDPSSYLPPGAVIDRVMHKAPERPQSKDETPAVFDIDFNGNGQTGKIIFYRLALAPGEAHETRCMRGVTGIRTDAPAPIVLFSRTIIFPAERLSDLQPSSGVFVLDRSHPVPIIVFACWRAVAIFTVRDGTLRTLYETQSYYNDGGPVFSNTALGTPEISILHKFAPASVYHYTSWELVPKAASTDQSGSEATIRNLIVNPPGAFSRQWDELATAAILGGHLAETSTLLDTWERILHDNKDYNHPRASIHQYRGDMLSYQDHSDDALNEYRLSALELLPDMLSFNPLIGQEIVNQLNKRPQEEIKRGFQDREYGDRVSRAIGQQVVNARAHEIVDAWAQIMLGDFLRSRQKELEACAAFQNARSMMMRADPSIAQSAEHYFDGMLNEKAAHCKDRQSTAK